MLSQVFARIIMFYTIIRPLASFFGVPTSVLGFQEGTESVANTGLYKLHAGEKVTPRYDATKSEKEPLNIYNLITSEAVASAMAGKEGENVVINIINRNSLRNGMVRKEIVRR